MSTIYHNAVIITAHNRNMENVRLVYCKAVKLFEERVSSIMQSDVNGFVSFFIAPGGSKAGWPEETEEYQKREELMEYIDSFANNDTENQFTYIDIMYNNTCLEIAKTNISEGD